MTYSTRFGFVTFIISGYILFSVTHFFSPCFRWPDSPARLKKSRAKRWWGYLHSTMDLPVVRKHTQTDFYEEPVIVSLFWGYGGWREKTLTLSSLTLNTTEFSWSFTAEDCVTQNPLLLLQRTTWKNDDLNSIGLDELSIFFISLLWLSCVLYAYWE